MSQKKKAAKPPKSKHAMKAKAGATSSSKKTVVGSASADNKAKPKDKTAAQTDEGNTAAASTRPLSTADLAAAQEHNKTSPQARLRLADVLKETLEEASIAVDQDATVDSSSKTDEVAGEMKTDVEQTKARLVELYNQVSARPAIAEYGYWSPWVVFDSPK